MFVHIAIGPQIITSKIKVLARQKRTLLIVLGRKVLHHSLADRGLEERKKRGKKEDRQIIIGGYPVSQYSSPILLSCLPYLDVSASRHQL